MTELTEIEGVGPSYADDLQEAGYESPADVADADAEELNDIIPTMSGEELIESAGAEADASEEERGDDEETEDPAKEEVYTIEPGFSDDQEHHLISALVNQEIKARQTNNKERLEATTDAISQVRAGEPYEMTLQQLSIAYTGSNQLESQYRGTRGLSPFVSKMREVRDVFQKHRRHNWPDEE